MRKYVGEHLKYHMNEHESMREIHTEREKKKTTYVKTEKAL